MAKKASKSVTKAGTAGDEKLLGILSYLGILVLIPLLLKSDSAFVKAHVKQGLALLIAWLVNYALMMTVILIPVALVLNVVLLVGSIVGIVKVLQGKTWTVPVVGKYTENWSV